MVLSGKIQRRIPEAVIRGKTSAACCKDDKFDPNWLQRNILGGISQLASELLCTGENWPYSSCNMHFTARYAC